MELTENELLEQARLRLGDLLPDYVEVVDSANSGMGPIRAPEALWEIRAQSSGYNRIFVEAKRSFAPRDVERVHGGLTETARKVMNDPVIMVVAPWLSARSRALLQARGYAYVDMTGNVHLRTERPAIYLQAVGADRDPSPTSRPPARLRGAKARRLVRLLVDVMPPHRVTDLAWAGELNRGYVSSLLQSLDEQALIQRDRKGAVTDVDWPEILSAAANQYDLLKSNASSLYVAPTGAAELFRRLIDESAPDVVVTGSFAASAVAPVSASAQLVLYVKDPEEMRQFGGLLPADRGADVVLLRPEDPSQVSRTREVDGRKHVGLSQLVLDCLGGNGRLPEEGLAVLDWMRAHEQLWRLPEFPPAGN